MFPYLVCQFAKSTVSNLVKECFGSDFPNIINKRQINYIYNYLSDLGAESVLLESSYVDKDYLEDYSNYYVKCFNEYGSRSARLHFFSKHIDHTVMDNVLANACQKDLDDIQESYLGFIVVKPLPKTFIGKTCLRTYPAFAIDECRNLISRDYVVNLFGIELKVNSIAFQEQDKVLSACATTAIWSSLHAIEWKDTKNISSCGKITSSAINHISDSSNRFPNNGLTNKQILRALDVEGLKHQRFDVGSKDKIFFFNKVKSHIDSGLPLILGAKIYELSSHEKPRYLGGHAVTVLGYKDLEGHESVYIHDDRIGPFARAAIEPLSKYEGESEGFNDRWCLTLQEKDEYSNWKKPHQILVPESIIIPSHRKNRIPESYVRNTCDYIVAGYDSFVKSLESAGKDVSLHKDKVRYKIKLQQVGRYKKEILFSSLVNKSEVLLSSLARFQWVASFLFGADKVFDVLFDATDIPQGNAVSIIAKYDKGKFDLIAARLAKFNDVEKISNRFHGEHFWDSFLSSIKLAGNSYQSYLDEKYGALRAPKYLTEKEVQSFIDGESRLDTFYGECESSLDEKFALHKDKKLIWAISHEGALLIGAEKDGLGHPSITGLKPARIAGELFYENYCWAINSKSGRYSGDYKDSNELLKNALLKFKEVFYLSRDQIEHRPFYPE
ncbi:hypothetical protein [Marinobacterium sp. BA1]|uniref:hypothetical protein n=1 Tax=Marinobacterium sp. BA1 TaxID=3138931 RepID=UPI0032E6A5EA